MCEPQNKTNRRTNNCNKVNESEIVFTTPNGDNEDGERLKEPHSSKWYDMPNFLRYKCNKLREIYNCQYSKCCNTRSNLCLYRISHIEDRAN